MNEKLTKETLAAMTPKNRDTLMFRCNSTAEFQAAQRNAYYIRANFPRQDGYDYRIKSSARSNIVVVQLIPKP